MGLVLLECGNADSCPAGEVHAFPDEDTPITIKGGTYLRIVGEVNEVKFLGAVDTAVEGVDPEAHQVMAVAYGIRVWVAWPEEADLRG